VGRFGRATIANCDGVRGDTFAEPRPTRQRAGGKLLWRDELGDYLIDPYQQALNTLWSERAGSDARFRRL
jgi:hypothetical protein